MNLKLLIKILCTTKGWTVVDRGTHYASFEHTCGWYYFIRTDAVRLWKRSAEFTDWTDYSPNALIWFGFIQFLAMWHTRRMKKLHNL